MKLSSLSLRTATQMRQRFVPSSDPVNQHDVDRLSEFVAQSKRLFVLTGAGLSTESGIPDYRSDNVGLYARTSRRPIQYQEFVTSAVGRQRYWARNFVGWPQFSSFRPNIAHKTLSEWETQGKISWLVTQNVDRLHSKAGSRRVTELHGSTHHVVCLSCDHTMSRWHLQSLFEEYNPTWKAESMSDQLAPDGDVIISDEVVKTFKVYSGYRFVRKAAEDSKPIAVVNIGDTRADDLITFKVKAQCGQILPMIDVQT